ncbi:uncharacterized protein L969DRAFT_91612 [Mixia osmundae IAM 14324]|uniref:Ribosomal protein L17 n=1 Tax=Mixia osmundae (strain CBS 9802 / IAM 14324 / JCM 22182 / KY 12970) TaxID=764103 RepID=G7DZZ6_MIXOS|nr:uncharacterized protein L969DRAFT_91612 [Mixia osmundae IAM 14324]KEI42148.1 hypothetical protein L969DRAFT_91612 [Mixia osmundae IAM 14324]GAA96156.1 hypothetical protein E5Q_02817 [Mixia osmundae IAM 14324]
MRHRLGNSSLGRMTQHRLLMLRNMVSSLIEHEQIKTTVPKARQCQRMAEKFITLARQQSAPAHVVARGMLMSTERTVPKLFKELAVRYADRPGGYTRIHLYGNRLGDHAPHAILEFVDGPKDLLFAQTALTLGHELALKALAGNRQGLFWRQSRVPLGELETLAPGAARQAAVIARYEPLGLRKYTLWNLGKIFKFRDPKEILELEQRARDHFDVSLARAHQEPVDAKDAMLSTVLRGHEIGADAKRNNLDKREYPVRKRAGRSGDAYNEPPYQADALDLLQPKAAPKQLSDQSREIIRMLSQIGQGEIGSDGLPDFTAPDAAEPARPMLESGRPARAEARA